MDRGEPLKPRVLIFEDAAVDQLRPITLLRPAYNISMAGATLWGVVHGWSSHVLVCVRAHLKPTETENGRDVFSSSHHDGSPTILINARLIPRCDLSESLDRLAHESTPVIVHSDSEGGDILAAWLPQGIPPSAPNECDELSDWLSSLGDTLENRSTADQYPHLQAVEFPHHILRSHFTHFADAVEHRVATGEYTQTSDGLFLGEGVELGDYLSVDTRKGPVVIGSNTEIGPHVFIRGPAIIEHQCRVTEFSAIKDGTHINPVTKVGGEVESSILESYANKQHTGFLGHSYVGSWVNLGAGTTNSDLKNTYGVIRYEHAGGKIDTGMNFMGAIIGDYAKTAIHTSIFTGKSIGVGSMVYGAVTRNVPSFINYAHQFGLITGASIDSIITTQNRMFSRRNVVQRPCDEQLLRAAFELTKGERVDLAHEPPSF